MRAFSTGRILCVDLELTTPEEGASVGFVPEIVQIGLVEADMTALEIRREATWLVRPLRSTVTPFLQSLTGITPKAVRKDGRRLEEVLNSLRKEFGPSSKVCAGWGDDWTAIDRACRERGIENPFPPRAYLDLGQVFAIITGSKRPGLDGALQAMSLSPSGRRHDALDDARDAAMVLIELAKTFRSLQCAPPSP